jgi:predicted nucleic acid-binding Zn ribbon protein
MCDTQTKICAQCGSSFQPVSKGGRTQIYCSERCRYTAKDRRRGRKPRNAQSGKCSASGCEKPSHARGLCISHYQRLIAHGSLVVVNHCVQCGIKFEAERKKTLCSLECKSQRALGRKRKASGGLPISQRLALRKKLAKSKRACTQCGSVFIPNNKTQVTCSFECRNARRADINAAVAERKRLVNFLAVERSVYARWSSAAHKREKEATRYHSSCTDCGCEIERKPYNIRCDACKEARRKAYRKSEAYKAQRFRNKSIRRAKVRLVKIETFSPLEVLRRDNWTCYICGVETPETLRGTYEDNAPEVDHIIPIAVGGAHSLDNVACACRRCNIQKGDKILYTEDLARPPMHWGGKKLLENFVF